MRDTVVMVKRTENGVKRYEITSNKNNNFGGNAKGKANWVVFPHGGKAYKVEKLANIYKQLRADGYKLEGVY